MKVPGLCFDPADEELAWRETSVPGVRWLPLRLEAESGGRRGSTGGDSTVLIRMEPGCGYPPHRHVGAEDVLVLRGGYRDGDGEHVQGDYVRYAAGSTHAPVALGDAGRADGPDNPACVLFAIAREGIEVLRTGSEDD